MKKVMSVKTLLITVTAWLVLNPAPAVEVEVSASSGEPERLIDGVISDRAAYGGRGLPLVIEFNFPEARSFNHLRMHPGFRGIAHLPSSDCSPQSITVSTWTENEWRPVAEKMEIPPDPGSGSEYYVDIPLEGRRTARLRIDVHTSRDTGRRLSSDGRVVVPPEERNVYIRQIEFFTTEEQEKLKTAATELIERFQLRTARDDRLGEALKYVFRNRFARLEAVLEDQQTAGKHYQWLKNQFGPYAHARLEAGSGNLELTVYCRGERHTPVKFPLHFDLLERLAGTPLSRDHVQVLPAAGGAGKPLGSRLELLRPDRGELIWNLTASGSYRIRFFPPVEIDVPLSRLLGDGDHMLRDRRIDVVFPPGDFWSARFADIFGTGRPALLAGYFTDFGHIFENTADNEGVAFDERRHFVARDPFDDPVATSSYHGRAMAVADAADLDGDGKVDLILSRFQAETPLFVRNKGDCPEELKFAEATRLRSLKPGYRYAYGDLDEDGLADAVGVRVRGEKVEVSFWRGTGSSSEGVPVFEEPVVLDMDIPDSIQYDRRSSGRVPVVSLDDLNGNGSLDISVLAPPYLYVAFARRDEPLAFKAPRQVRFDDGSPFKSPFYFPHFGWHDLDGDGVPDLIRSPGFIVHSSGESVLTVARGWERVRWLRQQERLVNPRVGMAGFDMADIYGRDSTAFLQVDDQMKLNVFPYDNGVFSDPAVVDLEPSGAERYGCPDYNEYGSLYTQIKAADLDGDGLPDLLLNSEHNWRFGYYSFYRNRGDGSFAAEVPLAPNPDTSYLQTEPSPSGKALVVNRDSILDYLSLRTDGLLSSESGRISFSFSPSSSEAGDTPRALFSAGTWRPDMFPAQRLYELYLYSSTAEEIFERIPYFALLLRPDGTLLCRLGAASMSTAEPVDFEPGSYRTVEVQWDARGTRLLVDGERMAASGARPPDFAERIHIGSLAWHGVQRDREYPDRWEAHPVDFSFPAAGRFDFLRFEGPDGNTTLDLDFDENLGDLARRSRIVYRCTPGVARYEGRPALIAHFGDHRRHEQGDEDKAVLHVVPFAMQDGGPPRFKEAIPLTMADGSPFYAFSRTQVVPIDWNGNGLTDIVLSAPGFASAYNHGVELFVNDGQWRFRRKSDPELKRLNELLHAHHDTKLVPAALLDNEEPDLATWTDPGLRVFSRPYLRRDECEFFVDTVYIP